MREIKFRAWNPKDNMYESPVTFSIAGNGYTMTIDSEGDINGQPSWIIEQYTGLKDKNGVEIYEGDIVADWEQIDHYKVLWNTKWACFELYRLTHYNDTDYEINDAVSSFIIGNIHENPELLK